MFIPHPPLQKSLHFLCRKFSNFSPQLPFYNHHHLVSLISSSRTLKDLLQIHTQLIVSGFTQDNFTNTHLIDSYSLFTKINLARLVFNGTPNPNVILWNSMIKAHIRSNQHREAIIMYDKMLKDDHFAARPDKYTYTFVLKACTVLLDIEKGVLIHEEIVKIGLESDVYIGTGLVDMYCKAGDLAHARQVFDKMPNKDVVVWNAMVSGLSQSPEFSRAIEAFQSMQLLGGVEPNSVSLLNLFPAVCKLSSLKLCRSIHGYVVRRTFSRAVVNGLIDVYSKCKRAETARRVFELMQGKDDVSWGTMMSGYAHNGCYDDVMELFDQMTAGNLKVNIVSVVSALLAAAKTKDLKKGKEIHDCAKQNKFNSEVCVSTPLVTMFAKCGELQTAHNLFRGFSGKDMVAWSAIVAAFAQSGHPEESLSLFRDMQKAGFKPSVVTIVGVLPACGELCSKKLGKSLHCYTVRLNLDFDVSVATSLVAMYAKCDDFASATMVFNRKCREEIVAWNALINRYAQIGEAETAMKMFYRLQLSNIRPDPGTMVGVVSSSAVLADLNLGNSVHGQIIRYGFESDCHVNNALIDMYAKSGSLASAERLFGFTETRDHVLWNVMIGAYTLHGRAKQAISTFREMKLDGFRPSLATVVTVLPAAASLAGVKDGAAVHGGVVRMGFQSHTAVGSSLIDMYSKCGRLDYAERVFREMGDGKDTVSWNAMLAGYAVNGRGGSAAEFFSVMQDNSVDVDPVSFLSVLSACRHAGLVDVGRNIFCSMKGTHGIEPKLEHYACMVDLLGRAGLFDETLTLVESMPMEADAGVWGALLGACRMHSNVTLAELALENLVKLEPENQAHYVVASSVYAESGRWGDARSVRAKMSTKTPGCSWVGERHDIG